MAVLMGHVLHSPGGGGSHGGFRRARECLLPYLGAALPSSQCQKVGWDCTQNDLPSCVCRDRLSGFLFHRASHFLVLSLPEHLRTIAIRSPLFSVLGSSPQVLPPWICATPCHLFWARRFFSLLWLSFPYFAFLSSLSVFPLCSFILLPLSCVSSLGLLTVPLSPKPLIGLRPAPPSCYWWSSATRRRH